jgi:hypothetical protein
MPEPTSSSVMAGSIAAGFSLSTLVPSIDSHALFGAILGASLIAYSQRDLKPWQRVSGLCLSICAGYVSAPEFVANTFITQSGPGGLLGSVIVVPAALKVVEVIDRVNWAELISNWINRRS